MKLERFLSVHVASVLLVLGFVYSLTIFVFIEDWIGLQSSAGLLNSLIFSFFASLCFFSFLVCVLTDPGGVPSGFFPDVEGNHSSDQENKRSRNRSGLIGSLAIHARMGYWGSLESPFYEISERSTGFRLLYLSPGRDEYYMLAAGNSLALNQDIQEEQVVPARYRQEFLTIAWERGEHLRKCDRCSVVKPPRAHHCRVCRRCVLKMDHHCAWINNCVGHRNYKSFLLLVLYATISSCYSSIVLVCCTIDGWDSISSQRLKFFHVGCGLWSMGLSLTLGALFIWHVYLTSHNMTTIEYHEAKRASWLARKSGLSYHHPYDVGSYKNITLVLGPDMLKWLWPSAMSHIKNGLSFPTIRDSS